jgi:nicotinamidase-related amidase
VSWREAAEALPALGPPEFELGPATTALVVVDMQYVDAHRDHALGISLKASHPQVWDYYFTRVEDVVIPNTQRLLEAFRAAGMRVIHLTVGPELPDGADLLPSRREGATAAIASQLFPKGSFEHQILPEVAPAEGELVINKTSRGAFNSTGFEHALRNMGIRTLVMAGVTTCSCVETTARDAYDRAFNVVLVDDATADLDQASHDATMKQFFVRWGRVWTTDETLATLGSPPSKEQA